VVEHTYDGTQEDCHLEASLGYIGDPISKEQTNRKGREGRRKEENCPKKSITNIARLCGAFIVVREMEIPSRHAGKAQGFAGEGWHHLRTGHYTVPLGSVVLTYLGQALLLCQAIC
jgi:hypothetical protein